MTKGNCKDLERYVSNQEGKIPIFGYPLMTFSPPDSGRTLTDHKTWRVATLGNGVVQYKESIVDVDYLTRSIENLRTMGTKELSPRTLFKKKS